MQYSHRLYSCSTTMVLFPMCSFFSMHRDMPPLSLLSPAAQQQWRHLPMFLYGDSMGGAVAIQVHRRHPALFDGAVLLAPMCKVGGGPQV